MTFLKKLIGAAAFAVVATGAQSATLAQGESADFRFDLSALGDVALRSYGASCSSGLFCINNGLVMVGPGGGLDFAVGLTRGGSGVFGDTLFAPRGSDALSIAESISPTVAVAASVSELFVRVTALNGPAVVGSTNLSFDGASPATLFGTELAAVTPVPTPAAMGGLLTGVAAFMVLRRRARPVAKG